MTFDDFFTHATAGAKPYPYQRRFATSTKLPALLPVSTGLGKSATLVLGWLYRRREHPEEAIRQSTPRRLAYCFSELEPARDYLADLDDVGLISLAAVEHREPPIIVHTVRCKDLLELWDTTPDLSGNDLDVSRYIRDSDDNDVQFFWREFAKSPPAEPGCFPGPGREELCAVGIQQAREFVKKLKNQEAWRWDPLEREWQAMQPAVLRPGMVLLLHRDAGGYDALLGWTGDGEHKPMPRLPVHVALAQELAAMDEEEEATPVELTPHLLQVAASARRLAGCFEPLDAEVPWEALATAARWHDVGKAHPAYGNDRARRQILGLAHVSAPPTVSWLGIQVEFFGAVL
ncbi:MAG: hypothetical protein GXY83_37410 [Rhodopirellula sp.]|nr:hypothetical protein [Rhodopirellula sp.]